MASAAIKSFSQSLELTIEFRASTTAFLLKSGTGWLLIAATVATAGMAAIITLPVIGFKWLTNRTSTFALEGDRLFMRRGILVRHEEEIELFRVKDVKATFSIIQQLFGNGSVEIISSDATGEGSGGRTSFIVSNVPQAREIREELRLRVTDARKRAGVREFDRA